MQQDFYTADRKHSVTWGTDTQLGLMKQQKPPYQNKQSNKMKREKGK